MSWAMRKENWDLIRNATRNINTRNTTVSLDESGVGVGASGLSQTGHHLGATIEAWSYCKLYVCGSLTASWRERQRESIYEQKDERESFYWERDVIVDDALLPNRGIDLLLYGPWERRGERGGGGARRGRGRSLRSRPHTFLKNRPGVPWNGSTQDCFSPKDMEGESEGELEWGRGFPFDCELIPLLDIMRY